jgi:hypothetical protein
MVGQKKAPENDFIKYFISRCELRAKNAKRQDIMRGRA